ncbi:hypothetical protein JOF29_002441 [Kribbella aluminosa]|uniref:Uncharacterized protein n=1 Tax=Kribbella aluminosa TaxID=416017 RepID=A0ABS4UIB9_9ACTN|nr:hypothetical protein [Kribbella aluminosa]MBP2351358.1 hypothetical protein [Kribbella aluminosa]
MPRLIHWPNPAQDRYVEAWQGLSETELSALAALDGTAKPAADSDRSGH